MRSETPSVLIIRQGAAYGNDIEGSILALFTGS